MRLSLAGLVAGILAGTTASAQYVISAHSGVVQVVEGRVYLNDNSLELKFGQFPEVKENQELRTEEGRAEVLLTPGVFLRMGENSSIRMVSAKLSDTRVEVLSGSVMVECDEIAKDDAVTLLYKQSTMLLVKHGLYRVDTDPARFQVYDGEAIVKGESGQLTLRSGKQTGLEGALMAVTFDKKDGDELYRWSSRRAAYLAKANVSSATSLRSSTGGTGGWQWNALFGLFTWVPYRGIGYSPFGYSWYSPVAMYNQYYRPVYNGGNNNAWNNGWGTGSGNWSSGYPINNASSGADFSGGGFSRGVSSAPATSAPSSGGAAAPSAGAGGGAVRGR